MKLCLNTIACRNAAEPLEVIIDGLAAQGGYRAIELWLPKPETLSREAEERIGQACRRNGFDLPVVSGLLGQLTLEMDNLDEQLALCRTLSALAGRLGARYLRCFPGLVGEVSSRNPETEYYRFVVEACRKFCGIIAPLGQKLVSETHCDTFVDTAEGSLKFIRDVGAPNHGLIMQLGVVPRWSGLDSLEFYRAIAPHVLHMHLHPYPWMEHEDNLEHYARLLPVLERENPDFYISVENCDGHVPPLEAARFGADLIARLAAGQKVEAPREA